MLRSICMALGLVLAFFCSQAMSDVLVQPSTISGTENGVFTDDGRYFVCGDTGINEVKPSSDSDPLCVVDPAQNLTVCNLVDNVYNGTPIFFSGMTTDGTYLYACALEWPDAEGDLPVEPPSSSALFRILPGENGVYEQTVVYLDEPAWYNGMTMLDDSTILMSRSQSGLLNLGGPAIEKLTITNHNTLSFELSDWLASSMLLAIPNGIEYDGSHVYMVSASALFRIPVFPNGSAGIPVQIYQAPLNKLMDDFAMVGNWLAVAEIGMVNGLGVNAITWVHKLGTWTPWKTCTGLVQLSHLRVDPGLFGAAGSLVGTSYYQGGLYYYSVD